MSQIAEPVGLVDHLGAETHIVKTPLPSDWTTIADLSASYGAGKMKKDLYDPDVTSELNSRLTYGSKYGVSVEGFARFDHVSGLFAKGFLGFGTWGKLGPSVVYRFYSQLSNGSGCTQAATGNICATPIPMTYLGRPKPRLGAASPSASTASST